MDISSSANASFGSALMVASLAKKQQTQDRPALPSEAESISASER